MAENNVPESAMVIVAHPDDAEFIVAGTVAAWTKDGCRVTYVVCTDGNAGSHEPGMTREKLAEIRRTEQRAACATLGVTEVVFLGYDDGQLQPTLELRRDLVRVIRQYKPSRHRRGSNNPVLRRRVHQPSRSSRRSASGARRGSAGECHAAVMA